MSRKELIDQIFTKQIFLCVGLDPDLSKIPAFLGSGPEAILRFNRDIIDATRPYCVAYKTNFAFYEILGTAGWQVLEETIRYIGHEHFIIADAKRGDIGNTAKKYAVSVFDTLGADAITLSPYMGIDSILPFLEHKGKWAIPLALTSNIGSSDFQQLTAEGRSIFEHVLQVSQSWGTPENMMYVVGATRAEHLKKIRQIVPEHFLLIPGIGAQGGSLYEVVEKGMIADCGLLVNSSRGILYKSSKNDFSKEAAFEAKNLQQKMTKLLP